MPGRDNSLIPSSISCHQLEKKARWQWWQLTAANKRKGGQHDAFTNHGIQACVFALLSIPAYGIMSYQQAGWTWMHSMSGLLCIILLFLLISFLRRHRQHVMSVEVTETGLLLSSPFLKRNVRWTEVVDFFPVGTVEPQEYLLECKNGDEFLLSRDLSDSDNLFKIISSESSQSAVPYDLNYRLPDGFVDQSKVCVSVVLAAILSTLTSCLLNPSNCAGFMNLTSLLFLSLLFCLALLWSWLNLKKTPQLIRMGRTGLYVRSGREGKYISWEQITQIRKLASCLIVNSRLGWFIVFASKNEPLSERLLEHRKTSLMLNQKQ